jgi:glutamate synthase domain-containing protein 2
MLLGQKISPRVAKMRTLPQGIDQRSACRHPDWVGPDDLTIKIAELREITDWQLPIYVKFGATRVRDDVKLAVKAGADVIVIDGMQGGTAATQQVFIEHAGIPTLPALRLAVEALDEMNVRGQVQLIVRDAVDGLDEYRHYHLFREWSARIAPYVGANYGDPEDGGHDQPDDPRRHCPPL